MCGRPARQGPLSRSEHSVSPYLLRPRRSLERARRDLSEKADRGTCACPGADTSAEPDGKPAHDAPED